MTREMQKKNAESGVGVVLPKSLLRQLSENAIHPEHVQVTLPSPGNLQSSLKIFCNENSPLLKKPLNNHSNEIIISEEETIWSIFCQVLIPFLLAGFGTVAAGLLLEVVQDWPAFQAIPELFVLIPALLGLKGNLEMTLAARISTSANLGTIDSKKEQWKLALGNLALLQCQSAVLGFLASVFASCVGWIQNGQININNVLLLSVSSLVTASVASLLLGSFTIIVVICSRKLNINPDNVAAPLSASLGDVITLALLSWISNFQFSATGLYRWLEIIILVGLLLIIPLWISIAYKNQYTRQVLCSGWLPIISAVVISSGSGFILNFGVLRFKEIAAYQPIINGIGGNLVAVQACRISTYLHRQSDLGCLLSSADLCISPLFTWFGKNNHARTCRILVLISIPGNMLFITCVHFLKSSNTPMSGKFLLSYLFVAIIQVSLLLYLAYCVVHWLWRWRIDPDDAAIPFLTALGDLLGTALLLLAFFIVEVTNHPLT